MALVFMDGFDALTTSIGANINNRKWYSPGTPNNICDTGRFGGFACACQQWLHTKQYTARSVWIAGFAIRRRVPLTSAPLSSQIIAFENTIGGTHCWVALNQSEILEFWGDGPGTAERLLATGSIPIRVGSWYYIEVKVTIDPTAGAGEVRVGGITDINVTGVNTTTTDPLNVAYGTTVANSFFLFADLSTGGTVTVTSPGPSGTISANFNSNSPTYDDIYLCDTTGSVNNNFLGEQRVNTIFANGAGNYTQWTPSSGSNYTDINEVAVNDDTTYVSTSTTNNIDTYTYQAVSITHVNAVGVDMISRMDDAGPHTIAPVLRISSTDYVGTAQSTTSSYADLPQVYDTNPNTSAAWTVSDVNSTEFGFKMIS